MNTIYVVTYSNHIEESWRVLGVFTSRVDAECYKRYKVKKHDYDNPRHANHIIEIETHPLDQGEK